MLPIHEVPQDYNLIELHTMDKLNKREDDSIPLKDDIAQHGNEDILGKQLGSAHTIFTPVQKKVRMCSSILLFRPLHNLDVQSLLCILEQHRAMSSSFYQDVHRIEARCCGCF